MRAAWWRGWGLGRALCWGFLLLGESPSPLLDFLRHDVQILEDRLSEDRNSAPTSLCCC